MLPTIPRFYSCKLRSDPANYGHTTDTCAVRLHTRPKTTGTCAVRLHATPKTRSPIPQTTGTQWARVRCMCIPLKNALTCWRLMDVFTRPQVTVRSPKPITARAQVTVRSFAHNVTPQQYNQMKNVKQRSSFRKLLHSLLYCPL